MRKTLAISAVSIFLGVFIFSFASAADKVGQIEQAQTLSDKEMKLREKIDQVKKAPAIKDETSAPTGLPESTEKVMVNNITVTGATLISEKEINAVIKQFKNKELMLKDMQKMVDLITDIYRKKGFVTSRAYLSPQKIEQGNLEVKVLEGITGEITFKGNRNFKSRILRKKITLKKGEPFDYEALRKGLSLMNEQADMNAKATIAPGQDPATTDVAVEVKDRLPIHVGLTWDNFGSRYIGYNRFKTTVTHNNLLGLSDSLAVDYQGAEAENYVLVSGRYTLPITNSLKFGFFAAKSRLKMQRELEDTNARGKSKFFSAYAIQSLINEENVDLNLNLGFDYKDIFNFQFGNETSRDRLRIARAGFDLDITDKLGRTLITEEFDYGIPDFMAGLKKHDDRSSRTGANGLFTKNTVNLIRLQKMPLDSNLLWKNSLQFSPYILTSAEQFQIGGISNVRGYPAAEAVGDNGYSMTWEYSVPLYFVPRSVKFPLSKAKIYDAIRFVGFYDWANTRLRSTEVGQEKNKTLRGAGCGLRINLPEDFSARVECAWPLDNKSSDGKTKQLWAEVSKTF